MRQSWDLRPAGTVGGARLLFMVLTGFLLWLAWGQMDAVQAQDPSKKDEPAAAKTDDAPAPAEAAPAAKAPQPSTSGGEEGTKPTDRNMLQWAIHASGPIGVFLLCLSIYFTALVIRLFMELRVSEAVPAAAGREARGRDPRQEVPGCLRRLQGQRLASWPGWCAPASPTCPTAGPRPRKP